MVEQKIYGLTGALTMVMKLFILKLNRQGKTRWLEFRSSEEIQLGRHVQRMLFDHLKVSGIKSVNST